MRNYIEEAKTELEKHYERIRKKEDRELKKKQDAIAKAAEEAPEFFESEWLPEIMKAAKQGSKHSQCFTPSSGYKGNYIANVIADYARTLGFEVGRERNVDNNKTMSFFEVNWK